MCNRGDDADTVAAVCGTLTVVFNEFSANPEQRKDQSWIREMRWHWADCIAMC
jgi:ADP-ribosylglycohydrolase